MKPFDRNFSIDPGWREPFAARVGHSGVQSRNRMPAEIVAIFERHGFIRSGKWGHFDTMHFEYRQELLSD